MALSGIWQGVIQYGPEYGPYENELLFFEMELSENDGNFSGTARDTGGFGPSDDEAHVTGFFDGEIISFIKQYAARSDFDIDGNVVRDESEKGQEITYTGTYNWITSRFSGDCT